MFNIRSTDESELDALAALWFAGWKDGHETILPDDLKRHRTLPGFRERLGNMLADTRVIGDRGNPLGFCTIRHDELQQLFVAAAARGTGVAAALLSDGERRLAERGFETIWLACAIGNHRAARFYEKHGWQLKGNYVDPVEIPGGTYPLEVWRYEKAAN